MAIQPRTLINGIAYSFVDISISIPGLSAPLVGFKGLPIKSISYNATQQKTANYENSKYATSYSYGKMTYTGNIGLTADAAEQFRDAVFAIGLTERSITAMPAIDIAVTFSNRGKVNVTTIKNVAFTTENLTGAEGNDTIAVSCDFIASHIQFNTSLTPQVAVSAAFDVMGIDNQGVSV